MHSLPFSVISTKGKNCSEAGIRENSRIYAGT
jgi:hypothetical protein